MQFAIIAKYCFFSGYKWEINTCEIIFLQSNIGRWKDGAQISDVTGGGQGGRVPPETSDREIFADVSGKKRQGKKGKRGENWEEKVENWKLKQENVIKRGEDLFAFHFWKQQKFVLGLPKWEFSTGEKNQESNFAPSEKYACYAPGSN